MLNNIDTSENLRGLARARASAVDTKTISKALLPEFQDKGWTVERENTASFRITREKSHGVRFEDRVWTLLYRLGFQHLSGAGGASILIDPKNEDSPKNQIDAVAIDDEVAIAVECKSSATYSKRAAFMEELAKFAHFRPKFSQYAKKQYGAERSIVFAFWIRNIQLSDNDRERAKQANVVILDENDLDYYEKLLSHIGAAARYQLLADLLEGRDIPGLEIKVPAVRIRMGGNNCYTFNISPEYLLKIAYVSHRMKGKAANVETYQRMLKKTRLTKIQEFIKEDGIFPTNIVVNLPKRSLAFQRAHQEGEEDGGKLGWLDIRPAYKSAWIIDGQHRLFAYSGLDESKTAVVAVLAFEGMSASKQASLFIEINSKQKKVPQSLLEELYAELHWDSEIVSERVSAIISRTAQLLGTSRDSALFGRVQSSDETKDELKCITLTALFKALENTEFFIVRERKGEVLQYGIFWAGENERTLKRTFAILNSWFHTISLVAHDWWNKGSGKGGGLAMNDGVVSLIGVLRSVVEHLSDRRLEDLDDEDVCEVVKPYANVLGNYLASLNENERKMFREHYGGQGQLKKIRICQKALRDAFPKFNPPRLDEYLEAERQQTNSKSKEIVDRIEKLLQTTIIEELKREFSGTPEEWWTLGVPREIRQNVSGVQEQDDNRRCGREYYFNLLHYKHIAMKHWRLFDKLVGFGDGGKEKQLGWIDFVNDKRNIVAHPTSGVTISIEVFNQLQQYEQQLRSQTSIMPEIQAAASAGDIAE